MSIVWPLGIEPQREIELATHRGTHIDNGIGIEPNEDGRRQYELERAHHAAWQRRRPPHGTYNCWGMLFASRRTGVYEDAIVDLVLEEDGYRLLDNYQDIQRGDIVVYRMGRTLLHGGLVVGVRPAQPMPMIKVLSKWNIGAGEDFHDVGDFHTFWAGCAWEVWTDRPLAEDANVRPIVLG